jgi:hypothetical protein
MLEAADADLALEPVFVGPKPFVRVDELGDQISGNALARLSPASRWRRPVLSLAARRTELHRSCGTQPPFGHAHDAAGCI